MRYFRDYLKEEFKDKEFEKSFHRSIEKGRIALEIAYHREKANLSQEDLAKLVKSSQSAISRLENPDYKGYSLRVLRRIADAFGLELYVSLREKHQENKASEWKLTPLKSVPQNITGSERDEWNNTAAA